MPCVTSSSRPDNVVVASFCFGKYATTRALWQWDYGIILTFDGIELPNSYQVHFANSDSAAVAKTETGDADGVEIPRAYLMTGLPVYAWVYLNTGSSDGETVYAITIPVQPRPKPEDIEPTPEEQSLIDQIIAALNAGVEAARDAQEAAETAASHYPRVISDYWYVWDVDEGAYVSTGVRALGEDGYSPTVTITAIAGGHRVTITGADGDHVFDVMDGNDGADGTGIQTITYNADYTLTITLTDGRSITTGSLRGEIGEKGDTGNGIAGIVKTSTSGLVDTYTITYTDGNFTTFAVTNGAKGDPGPQGQPGDDYVLTAADKAEIAELVDGVFVATVSGADPVIAAEANHRYVCATVSTISITPPASGSCEVIFTSGSPAAVLTLPQTVKMPDWWGGVEVDYTYDIIITDGVYGGVMAWALA